ncbi:MAG: DUF2911 domain-containing protein [Bacteroidota bacterium]
MYKQLFSLVIFLILSLPLNGQVEYLRLSPAQKIIQRVGATDVELAFSRPQMKGRTVFGELIPYGKMWRTGANENTKISFSHRVRIGETEVAEGTYALCTKPGEKSWEIFLYTDTNNLDVPNPIDSSKLIYLTRVNSYELSEIHESLVINFYDITETTANLGISWERTAIKIPILFYTREAMEKSVEKEFRQNVFDYRITAIYYAQRGIELEKAKKLQELVMSLVDKVSAADYHYYGNILSQLGEREQAIQHLERSLEMANKDQNIFLISRLNASK